jgi:plasmid stabilization system protein ParE
MKVEWQPTAAEHLVSIYQYIARDSKRYARKMVDRITARSKQLGRFPQSGQVVPEFGDPSLREIVEGAYRVIYRVLEKKVSVVAVVHAARAELPDLNDESI